MVGKPSKTKEEQFLAKVNSDTAFRNKFLDDPVGTLRDFGISLEPEVARKIEATVSYLKNDIKHIFEIPSGSSNYLKGTGVGIKIPPELVVGPDTEPEMKVT